MNKIPVLGFAAYSGTGKTTLIEKLVVSLKAHGLRIAVVKHDAHRIDIDKEGKDSWRFSKAGAKMSIVSSKEKTACIEQRSLSFVEILSMVHDVDLILVEGYKNEPLTQIGICRKATGKGFPKDLGRYVAVVTDMEDWELDCVSSYKEDILKSDCASSYDGDVLELSSGSSHDGDVLELDSGSLHDGDVLKLGSVSSYNRNIPKFGFEEIDKITEYIMKNMDDFTHFNEEGRAKMVDVGEKEATCRTATAAARVLVNEETFALIKSGGMKKGDVLTVAQIAGVMGAKHTPDIIPMCHPILINGIDLKLTMDENGSSIEIQATVSCSGKTGVEMEALTAVSTAALTVYDMCKAVQKDIVITDIRLMDKTGGIHGDYHRKDEKNETYSSSNYDK